MERSGVVTEADEPLHPQDAAARARLRARLKLSPGERWELWVASMRGLEGWQGIARGHPQPAPERTTRPARRPSKHPRGRTIEDVAGA